MITGFFGTNFIPTPYIYEGTIYVQADGIDTTGSVVRFQRGESSFQVAAGTAVSSVSLGLVVAVAVPGDVLGLSGPWEVSIRQGSGAFSAPVNLSVAC